MTAEPGILPLVAIAPEVRRRERNRRLIGLGLARAGGRCWSWGSCTTRSCSSSR